MSYRSSPLFTASLPPIARNPRAAIGLMCEARQGSRRWRVVRLDDLSERGFRLGNFADATTALPVNIRIPGLHLLTAHIRWQAGDTVGCEFAAPLHVAVFEHLARTLRGE